ncbi:MAG: PA0069 family radical SAM protein [Rubrivivax sp.]
MKILQRSSASTASRTARHAAAKGRGTTVALAHRFEHWEREPFDDGWTSGEPQAPDDCGPDGKATHAPAPVQWPHTHRVSPRTEVRDEQARTILSRNASPDIGFEVSINPYRGCEHGCSYCFARPTHAYLDLSPGLDFETRIVAKRNAAALLRRALSRPDYVPRSLALGTVTDAYQPVERKLRITRAVIEVLAHCHHAFAVITKSALIERDLDLLAPMAEQRLAAVYVSVTTLDTELARRLEPRAAAPYRRLQTIERLARSGVPVGVSVSPLIPFVNEPELEQILAAAASAGATSAFSVVLRLPWEVAPIFRDWLQTHLPDRAERVMARVQDMRGGRDNDPRFGSRMTGQGPWAALVRQRLEIARRRYGLASRGEALDLRAFRRPAPETAIEGFVSHRSAEILAPAQSEPPGAQFELF